MSESKGEGTRSEGKAETPMSEFKGKALMSEPKDTAPVSDSEREAPTSESSRAERSAVEGSRGAAVQPAHESFPETQRDPSAALGMTAGEAAPVVRLEEVHKIYHTGEVEVHAVRGVSLEIQRGEFVAFMGSSGSGKSTLMNILGCLDRPSRGRYLLDGIDVSGLERDQLADIRNHKLGFVFQSFNLLARTSARENVELPLLYGQHRLTSAQLAERADKVLDAVGLSGREEHHPSQLSGGQQQRVAIARALVNEPEVVLADEPTGNLDSRTSIEIMGIFQELNERGITIIMVTHEADIAAYARRNIVMRDGLLQYDRPVKQRLSAKEEARTLNDDAAAKTPA